MRYPVKTEKQLAARWRISLKTLRRWRADKIGPVYRRLGHWARYFEEDILEFERHCSRHWVAVVGRDAPSPIVLTPQDEAAQEEDQTVPLYINAKEAAEIIGLPRHLFSDRNERDRKRLPYLNLVGNVRYSLEEIYQWELINAVPAFGPNAPQSPDFPVEEHQPPVQNAPRWYEVVHGSDIN